MTAQGTSIPAVRKAVLAPSSHTMVRPARVHVPLRGLITPKIDMIPGGHGDGPEYIVPNGKKGNPDPYKFDGGTSCSGPLPIEYGLDHTQNRHESWR